MFRTFFAGLLVIISIGTAYSQNGNGRLKVFVDCSDTRCDLDYFRSEINIVDFYRDRLISDVHALITSGRSASGGRSYQMIFYGLNGMSSRTDTLRFNTNANATDFERRESMLQHLKVGLLPFIVSHGKMDDIAISMKIDRVMNEPVDLMEDPWDFWVFRLSGDGSYNADAVYKNYRLNGRGTISRVTEESKFYFSYRYSKNSRSFETDSDNNGPETVVVENHNQSIYNQFVKSISDHWSVGYEASYRDDTFSNYKSRITISPAIEYSIFPYEEFNNRFFTVKYSIGLWSANYNDTTIYNRIQETRGRHALEVNMDYNQKWGDMGVGARFMHYLDDFSVNNLSLNANIDVRITGGLFINASIFGSIIHDQLNLPKGDATDEEILTERRQLQTNFDFGTRFGISYRFGSNINNIVNPRFDD